MQPKPPLLHQIGKRGSDESAGASGAILNAVERFVRAVPRLRRLLALPAASDRELLLRAEMRRTIATLATTLDEAARGERRRTRAALYRAAANVAAELAAAPAALVAAPVSRDHC
ncbi:MAG TPA: hypothetical protein VF432_11650 [Thermoanaerobaculia bacterium]